MITTGGMPALAVQTEGVSKRFGAVHALDRVDLGVQSGTVFGLLGPNGAGKTTLVRILTTLLRPDAGRALVEGIDVVRQPARVREIIGLAGQYAAVDENLTGRENLVMVGQLYHVSGREARRRAGDLLAQFGLLDAADRTAKTYSGGMRRRLDLAASLVGHPRILFLDEPTSGLDPRTRIDLWNHIRELVRGGVTLLLTTQYLEEADELADRIAVIDAGKLIAEGTSEELKSRMGSDVIEVHVARREDVVMAGEALAALSAERPQTDAELSVIRVPVADGAQSLVAAVRRLDEVKVRIADISLRRPSLDDVFLALTGHAAEADAEARSVAGARRRGR